MDGDELVEETTQAPADSPTPGTGQEVNWQKRYEDTQAAFTTQAQEAAQLRQWQDQIKTDPAAREAWLREEFGYDIQGDDPEPGDDPRLSALQQELEELKTGFSTAQQQAEYERQVAVWDAQASEVFKQIEQTRGHPLTEKEQKLLKRHASVLGPGDDGLLPFEEAAAELEEIWETRQQHWATTKRPAHRVTPGGAAATITPDLTTQKGRREYARQLAADSD